MLRICLRHRIPVAGALLVGSAITSLFFAGLLSDAVAASMFAASFLVIASIGDWEKRSRATRGLVVLAAFQGATVVLISVLWMTSPSDASSGVAVPANTIARVIGSIALLVAGIGLSRRRVVPPVSGWAIALTGLIGGSLLLLAAVQSPAIVTVLDLLAAVQQVLFAAAGACWIRSTLRRVSAPRLD